MKKALLILLTACCLAGPAALPAWARGGKSPAPARHNGSDSTVRHAPVNGDLVEHKYYTNSAGKRVHAPAHTRSGHTPPGASARCRDGSWSFSTHHRGTCSRHQGVAQWL